MCGRFSLGVSTEVINERFEVPAGTFEWSPHYNIAPTQLSPIIAIEENRRALSLMRWGLLPHWSKEKIALSMINARLEGVKSSPFYRDSFKKRRCLVPADGFYEWKKTASGKVPFRVTLKDAKPFAFAGLWDSWQDEKGEKFLSFTILTTEADPLIAPLHDRMPFILKREDEATWLDASQDPEKLLLKISPESEMNFYEVSLLVNSWKQDLPECILPIQKETPAPEEKDTQKPPL